MDASGAVIPLSKRLPLRRLLLGWPALVCVWCYVIWFVWRLWNQISQPIDHTSVSSSIDPQWLSFMLPAMYIPTIVVFAYCNWLGWKFFQHN